MKWKRLKASSMIKDAVDNLPVGLCFFDGRGIPVLVNRTMHQLVFSLKGHDLQDISDIDELMEMTAEKPVEIRLDNGTIWQFSKRVVDGKTGFGKSAFVEIIATDITELSKQREVLKQGNEEQREVMERLEEISKDVVGITRNEEILAAKMRIHSELGFALSATRHFINTGCSEEGKEEYIKKQREMAGKLLLQTDMDDEPDVFSEFVNSAKSLGLDIILEGEISEEFEEIMAKVIRECLINVVRHGGGDKVFVKCLSEEGRFKATIQDNGYIEHAGAVNEGGGLKSIRKQIEKCGGTVRVETKPEFTVILEFN